uniref:Uncharacterized protein n=1 Tax=Echeneis naucrates TaxID=173247 RepID=A0A665UBN0_ECHNA
MSEYSHSSRSLFSLSKLSRRKLDLYVSTKSSCLLVYWHVDLPQEMSQGWIHYMIHGPGTACCFCTRGYCDSSCGR